MFQKSPKNIVKPVSPLPSDRSTTQSRIRERMTSSPLKAPLENAITKALAPRDHAERHSQSRLLVRSRLKDEKDHSTSRVVTRNTYKDEPNYLREKMHTETSTFLRKYFSGGVETVAIETFIEAVMREYEHLWGSQNSSKVFDDFNYKIFETFGENIELRQVIRRTLDDGMIGLILQIFKQIKNEERSRSSSLLTISKNPRIETLRQSFEDQLSHGQSLENIKNVVQEFMETMYQCMQSQIYNKFNVEMRRMVVKYREAERLMKKVNEKITLHADLFEYEAMMNAKKKDYDDIIEKLKRDKEELSRELFRERNNYEMERRQNAKNQQQIRKLKQSLEKFQNAVLSKVMQPSFLDPTLQRKITSTSGLTQRDLNVPQQPFKITIDTHIIQKDGEPPETKTYATLYNLGSLASPIEAPIAESRYVDNSLQTPYNGLSAYDSQFVRQNPISMVSRRL